MLNPRVVAVEPWHWLLVLAVLGAVWRFFAGQVVMRRPGRWDSRYLTWAAEVPENVLLSRDEGVPRTTWARRPGWHRQAVRLGSAVVLAAWWYWPTPTEIVVGAAIAVHLVRQLVDLHQLR
ncbi:MAG: hypothetical protein ACRD0H_32090, partial [Actinomycetes bacterium]